MTTLILKAEVQLRIDAPALVYTSGTLQAAEVLQLAVDTVGLGLDLTNIISVHNSISSAIVSGTSDDDLTAINAASIALGITDKPVLSIIRSIQRGSTSFSGTTSVTVSSVDMTKSFISSNVDRPQDGSSGHPGAPGVKLTTSTNINIAGSVATSVTVNWELIEYV